MGQDCSDCARLQVERASALKATHDLEKVLLREGDVEGAYERRLAEAVREQDAAKAETEREKASATRGWQTADELHLSVRDLKAEVERLQRELMDSEVAREALQKQRDEARAEMNVVRKDRSELRLQAVTLREALKGYYHECLCNRDEIRAANKRAYSALQMTDHLP